MLRVSVDGTKMQANASKHAAVSYARAGEMIAQLELEVAQLVTRTAQADAQEQKDVLDLPAELTRREDRQAALKQARAVIEDRDCQQFRERDEGSHGVGMPSDGIGDNHRMLRAHQPFRHLLHGVGAGGQWCRWTIVPRVR